MLPRLLSADPSINDRLKIGGSALRANNVPRSMADSPDATGVQVGAAGLAVLGRFQCLESRHRLQLPLDKKLARRPAPCLRNRALWNTSPAELIPPVSVLFYLRLLVRQASHIHPSSIDSHFQELFTTSRRAQLPISALHSRRLYRCAASYQYLQWPNILQCRT